MKKYLFYILLNAFLFLVDGTLFVIWLITKKQELMYPLGLCTGLFVSVLGVCIASILIRKKRTFHSNFDERQLKNRGDCYCVSFFFLLICLLLDGILRQILDYEWCDYLVGTFTWGMLSIGVFANMAIWKDAYTTESENKLRFGIFLGLIGMMDSVVGIVSIVQKDFIVDGKVDISFINLFGGIVLLITAINLIVKFYIDKRKVFVEDEEFETEVC